MNKLLFWDENDQRLEIEIVEPPEAVGFDPEEFELLLIYACEVCHGLGNKADNDIFVNGEVMDQGLQKVVGDTHIRFGKDDLRTSSFMHRYLAFQKLLGSGVLGKEFIAKDEKGVVVSIAKPVVDLLATFPLQPDSSVDPEDFAEELRKTIR